MKPLTNRVWWLWRHDGRKCPAGSSCDRFSPLVLRILAVNVIALAIFVGSLLYLGRYQEKLISSEIDSMMLQARMTANALGEGAVVLDDEERNILSPLLARLMIRRLVEATGTRTRLFDLDDTLLADSSIIMERGGKINVTELPAPDEGDYWITNWAMAAFDAIDRVVESHNYPLYQEERIQKGGQYEIVKKAISGEAASQVWSLHDGLLLTVSIPVQRYKQVLGAVMLSRPNTNVNAAIREVRIDILKIFGVTLLITVLLSLYLARAIARPLRLLAQAAEKVRHGQMQITGLAGTASLLGKDVIPDFSERNDEIGDLSVSLRDMTSALAKRIGAIENFAADVAHEIKNPLTSLRSAVETAERVLDPAARQKLMIVIRDDVDRLDRLISDISSASRLDAELSRDEAEILDVRKMLETLIGCYTANESGVVVEFLCDEGEYKIMGVEGRLVQVMQNLISNGLSFSPQGGKLFVRLKKDRKNILITVEDDGPGIPENKLEAIFDRFYSERPKSEKFGTHSGLGLSISKQIIEAHRGKIWAENKKSNDENSKGAVFNIVLPTI